jgi:hypothetical protein
MGYQVTDGKQILNQSRRCFCRAMVGYFRIGNIMPKQNPTANNGGGSGIGARGVTRPGYQVGSSKTSPVPGMSRTQAAINSLTKKGQAENQSRIDAMMSSNFQPRIGGHAK